MAKTLIEIEKERAKLRMLGTLKQNQSTDSAEPRSQVFDKGRAVSVVAGARPSLRRNRHKLKQSEEQEMLSRIFQSEWNGRNKHPFSTTIRFSHPIRRINALSW